ncbi:MAG: hypothetical protein ACJ79J_01755 [Gemmatimonadaceae bacterium]
MRRNFARFNDTTVFAAQPRFDFAPAGFYHSTSNLPEWWNW